MVLAWGTIQLGVSELCLRPAPPSAMYLGPSWSLVEQSWEGGRLRIAIEPELIPRDKS